VLAGTLVQILHIQGASPQLKTALAMSMIQYFAFITFCHAVSCFLWHATRTMKVYYLDVLNTSAPMFTQQWKA
jgi:uncharacterized protein with PQ loop repeat